MGNRVPAVKNNPASKNGIQSSANVLEVVNVSKVYGEQLVLDDVSLKIAPGTITSLLGKNGAGKSTLIAIICGALRSDGGQVKINGLRRNRSPKEMSRRIGCAFQETGLYPILTVAENLRFTGRCYGLTSLEVEANSAELADLLDLNDLMDRKCQHLSGGQKRRVHTAMAMVHKPDLLLLDEPTVGADPAARLSILETVQTMAREGMSILYTSHYFPEIEKLGGDIVILDRGRVLSSGSMDELLQKYGRSGVRFIFNDSFLEKPTVQKHFEEIANGHEFQIGKESLTVYPANVFDYVSKLKFILAGGPDWLAKWEIFRPDLENIFLELTANALPKTASKQNERLYHTLA